MGPRSIWWPTPGQFLVTSSKRKRLLDAYRFPGFRPVEQIRGVFGDPYARVIILARRSKKRPAVLVDRCSLVGTIARFARRGILPAGVCASSWSSKCDVSIVSTAAR